MSPLEIILTVCIVAMIGLWLTDLAFYSNLCNRWQATCDGWHRLYDAQKALAESWKRDYDDLAESREGDKLVISFLRRDLEALANKHGETVPVSYFAGCFTDRDTSEQAIALVRHRRAQGEHQKSRAEYQGEKIGQEPLSEKEG